MDKKVKEILNNYASKDDKLIIAVSGGPDSVVLLDLLTRLNFDIVIAHVNHGLRKESGGEEKFVRDLASKYNSPLYSKKFKLTRKTEEEARTKRYAFLRQVKEKVGAKYILTAHHLNDQVETVLLNMVRGTGPLDIWGMEVCENDILRPLLYFSKEEILKYVKAKKLKFVEDTTNHLPIYSRNKLRLEVIPKLRELNPNLLGTIENEVILGKELKSAILAKVKESEKKIKEGNTLNISKLLGEPVFIQKEIIRRALFEMTGKKEGIYSKNVAEILKLTKSKGNKKTKIRQFTIAKVYDKIIFDQKLKPTVKKAQFAVGDSVEFNGFLLATKVGAGKATKKNILLPKTVGKKFLVRTWQYGDKIKTSGGTKKLQDLFTDAKVSADERLRWPIVTCGEEIIWVPYLAACTKAQDRSENSLIIEVKKP